MRNVTHIDLKVNIYTRNKSLDKEGSARRKTANIPPVDQQRTARSQRSRRILHHLKTSRDFSPPTLDRLLCLEEGSC